MIVEVLGCTSSGKSTLIRKLLAEVSHKDVSLTSLSVKRTNLLWLLISDLVLLLSFMIFSKHQVSVFRFLKICLKRNDSLWMRVNLFRNFITKQGEFQLARRRVSEIILMDEGCLHAFSNIFSHYDDSLDIVNATCLIELVPKPDVILRIVAPEEIVVARAKNRPDPPWPDLEDKQWRCIFRHTESLYQMILNKLEVIPVITVNSLDMNIPNVIRQLNNIYLREDINGS